MTKPTPTYRKSIFMGTAAWLASAAVLHWLPLPIRIDTRFTSRIAVLAFVNCSFFAALVYLLVRHKPVAERFPSTAAIVMPVAFGDALAVAFFNDFFPKISPDASGMFAALLLLTTAVILTTGFISGLRIARG
jgi:hypothetical protein